MFVTRRALVLTKFHFDSTYDSKEINISVTSIIKQCLMKSQILKSVDFTKTQNLGISKTNETLVFQIKKIIHYTSRATLLQK